MTDRQFGARPGGQRASWKQVKRPPGGGQADKAEDKESTSSLEQQFRRRLHV